MGHVLRDVADTAVPAVFTGTYQPGDDGTVRVPGQRERWQLTRKASMASTGRVRRGTKLELLRIDVVECKAVARLHKKVNRMDV